MRESTDVAIGRVVGRDDRGLWVEITPQAACGQCSNDAVCGTGVLGIAPAARRMCLPVKAAFAIGDVVSIHAPAAAIRRAALWAYGLPLFGVIGGAVLGNALDPTSGATAVIAAVLGLAAGFAALRTVPDASVAWRVERVALAAGDRPLKYQPRADG